MSRCTVRGPLASLVVVAVSVVTGCSDDEEPVSSEVPVTDVSPATTSPATDIDTDDPGQAPSPTAVPETTDGDIAPLDGPPAPDPSALPEATAPVGLGTPALPDDAEGVAALFGLLPDELLGATREVVELGPGRIAARFDPGDLQCTQVGLEAIDLTSDAGGFYPEGWQAEHIVALFASGADWDVEDAGRDGTRFWVTFENYCGGEDMEDDEIISSAVWGDAGSPWVFSVGASDDIGRAALLTAFVDAALENAATTG